MLRKILIVDDSAVNRLKLNNTLSGEYEILEATNGGEAMQLLQQHYSELSAVLLDIVMPQMDGYDVLRRMRENINYVQIPTIIVTALEDEKSRVKALSLGANDFILKPFNPEIVRHCLRNNILLRETSSILNAIQKDKLTGLYNREAFFERAKHLIAQEEPGAYILSCFDIDNFKVINDRYGAAEGDRILSSIGHTIGRNVRDIGGIAGRISADNFAVLIPTKKCMNDALRRILNKELAVKESLSITLSIGRYIITDKSLPPSAIYDRAFLAKQSVKGRYDEHLAYFDDTMMEKLVHEQEITTEMEQALKNGQFEVWFQPQYNHATGSLLGAEALVRWRHPQRGLIPPDEFIPLFERNGFVYEVDKFVWRETCKFLSACRERGYPALPVSVNVSRYDFLRTDLVDVLMGTLREFDIDVSMLRLEVTESALAAPEAGVVEAVKKLISLGFVVEIDDFGSGYSSLNTLKDVPAQVLKLDMRFLEDEDVSERGGNILESVVRMTKWLGMDVLAEGVERPEQADFLKSIGCTCVQGYLYAKPMPAAQFEALLAESGKNDVRTAENMAGRVEDEIWNSGSKNAQLFDKYFGSVCVLEYHGETLELVRVSDSYVRDVFDRSVSVPDIMKIDWKRHIDETTHAAIKAAMRKTQETGEEVTGEYRFVDLPGCPHEMWLQLSLRAAFSADDRHRFFCMVRNMTREYALRDRLCRTEEELNFAARLSGSTLCRYDLAGGTLTVVANPNPIYDMPQRIENAAETLLAQSRVSPETEEAYKGMFAAIHGGECFGNAEFVFKTREGWRRVRARFAAHPRETGSVVIAFSVEQD